jgi:16S rRNA (uracil1498-N3)-methyltransferase
MDLFYSDIINRNTIQLPQKESHHCINVKRRKKGDLVAILDGKGWRYTASIIDPNKDAVLLEIQNREKSSKPLEGLHLVISPTKSHDRIDWMVEKVTELGVKKISFISCKRTERKKINFERIKRITVSAIKQCGQYYLPEVSNITNYEDVISSVPEQQRFIAHLEEESKEHLSKIYDTSRNICVLIGAEGDFTDKEISFAKEHNFVSVTLGDNTLRTETAGVFVSSIINILNA